MPRPDYTPEDLGIESEDAKLLLRFLNEKKRVIRGLRVRAYLIAALALVAGAYLEHLFDIIP